MRRPTSIDDDYARTVKDFYRHVEDYDWIPVTDHLRGLESFLHRYRERETLRLLKNYCNDTQPFLDLGCGTGLLLRHLPEGSVGCDINPRYIAKARLHAPKATLVLCDAEELPFENASFSTVLCTEVLEHLPHPEIAVRQAGRVLRDGGIFIGSTPRRALLWRLRFLSTTHFANEPFHHEYEEEEIRALFSGWDILSLSVKFFGGFFFFVLRK